MSEILLSVIILNYKNPGLTAKCVRTVLGAAEEAKIPVEVIVVDNSALQTAGILRKLLPQEVQIVENQENLGFAKGNNQGIRKARGKYILLLNNDAFVDRECLQMGIDYLAKNPQVGIWAPRLYGETGQIQVSCSREPSLVGLVGGYLLGKNLDWYKDIAYWTQPTPVGTVIGACFMLRRDVLERVGLLDEDYFFTVEDIDYCKRVCKAGYLVIYDPRCNVLHIGGASQEHDWINNHYLHRYRVRYFEKHYGFFAAIVAALVIRIGLLLRKVRAWVRSVFQS